MTTPSTPPFNLQAAQVGSLRELLELVDVLGTEVSYQNEAPSLSSLPICHAFGWRRRDGAPENANRCIAQVSWSGFTFLQTSPEVCRLWTNRGLPWRGVLGFGTFLLRPELLQHYARGAYTLFEKVLEDDAVAACLFIEQAIRKMADVPDSSGFTIVPDASFHRDGDAADAPAYLQFSVAVPCSEEIWDRGMLLLRECHKAASLLETAMSADDILKQMKDIQERSKSNPPSSGSIH